MCSNSEEHEICENALKSRLSAHKIDLTKCKRCGERSFVLLQRKDPFCKTCFYDYCRHKFRSTIGKSNAVPHKSRVLVAFSGGMSSSAMTDLLLDSIHCTDLHRKLYLEPCFAFVDESICLTNDVNDKSTIKFPEIVKLCHIGFKSYVTSLEMCFESNSIVYEPITSETQLPLSNEECRQKWLSTFNSFKSLTSKEEYVKRMRHLLLLEIAKKENCDFIFLGTVGSQLAVNLLTDVIQGKGNQLHSEVGFCDERNAIKFVKPLREFVKKEALFWNLMRNVTYNEKLSLTTKMGKKASMSKLTEAFVTSLENDFPATVYTIVRTGNKLQPLTDSDVKCLLCASPITDDSKAQYSAVHAFQDSERITKNNPEKDFKKPGDLCYGCAILHKDRESTTDLVPDIVRKKQFDCIKEYLL